jgi:hypothetical protein
MLQQLGTPAGWRDVPADGTAKAAAMIAELLA